MTKTPTKKPTSKTATKTAGAAERRSRLPAIVLDYLPPDLHRAIRMRATAENTTMKVVVLRALMQAGFPVSEADLEDGRKKGRNPR